MKRIVRNIYRLYKSARQNSCQATEVVSITVSVFMMFACFVFIIGLLIALAEGSQRGLNVAYFALILIPLLGLAWVVGISVITYVGELIAEDNQEIAKTQ